MAEIVLAVLCIVAGLGCALLTLIVAWGSAIGAVTNAAAARNWPILVLALLSIAFLAGGISILVF
jgi:hypothetical protein